MVDSTCSDKSTQVPEDRCRWYSDLQGSSKRDIRGEIIAQIQMVVEKYAAPNQSAVDSLMSDVLQSKKFRTVFPTVAIGKESCQQSLDSKILQSLVRHYQSSKEKESNELIRQQGQRLKSKLLIGKTLKTSSLSVDGNVAGSNRIEAAKKLLRGTSGEDYCL